MKAGRPEGADPVEERREKQIEREDHRATFTVADLAKEFIEKWVKKRKVARSIYDDTRTLEKDVLPRWGRGRRQISDDMMRSTSSKT